MDEMVEAVPAPEPQRLSAFETWRLALSRPNEEAYSSIRDDPSGSYRRAIGWIALGAVVAFIIGAISQLLFVSMLPWSDLLESTELIDARMLAGLSGVFLFLYGLPASILVTLGGAFLSAGLIHFIAGALGGTGSFEKLFYIFAAISTPVTIISSLLGLIPLVNCLTVPIALYALVLNVLAIKVVHEISWGAALGTILILVVMFLLLIAVVALAVWGPLQEFLRSPEFLPSDVY